MIVGARDAAYSLSRPKHSRRKEVRHLLENSDNDKVMQKERSVLV